MKALIWIIALVLAIPTFGISLAIAVVITMYLNKQDQMVEAHFILSATSTLKNDIVNKYYRLRIGEGLSSTRNTDSYIFDSVMKCCTILEKVLKESGRFHDDKDDVIQLAVRLTSYSEDLDPYEFSGILKEELAYVANAGVVAALRRPYKAKSFNINFRAQPLKDDIDIIKTIPEDFTRGQHSSEATEEKKKIALEKSSASLHNENRLPQKDSRNNSPTFYSYSNVIIKQDSATYWVGQRSFGSAREAEEFIDSQA